MTDPACFHNSDFMETRQLQGYSGHADLDPGNRPDLCVPDKLNGIRPL